MLAAVNVWPCWYTRGEWPPVSLCLFQPPTARFPLMPHLFSLSTRGLSSTLTTHPSRPPSVFPHDAYPTMPFPRNRVVDNVKGPSRPRRRNKCQVMSFGLEHTLRAPCRENPSQPMVLNAGLPSPYMRSHAYPSWTPSPPLRLPISTPVRDNTRSLPWVCGIKKDSHASPHSLPSCHCANGESIEKARTRPETKEKKSPGQSKQITTQIQPESQEL